MRLEKPEDGFRHHAGKIDEVDREVGERDGRELPGAHVDGHEYRADDRGDQHGVQAQAPVDQAEQNTSSSQTPTSSRPSVRSIQFHAGLLIAGMPPSDG